MTQETTPTLWTDANLALAARLQALPRLLVACDFDGTLAPLTTDPVQAAALPEAVAALRRLHALPGITLALISGRRIDDLATRVPLPDVVLIGNHGLEMRGVGLDGTHGQPEECRPRLERLIAAAHAILGDVPGLRVEDKHLTVSVHYRQAAPAHHGRIAAELARLTTAEKGVVLHQGKMVWEWKPDSPWHKGTALFLLRRRLNIPQEATLFFGDDATDEDAFRALKAGHTFFVGPETAPTAARHRLENPAAVATFLHWLAGQRSLPSTPWRQADAS